MSELQQYYNAFCTGYWAQENPSDCPCRGSGWANSEVDTWHKCPIHYAGQSHPEDGDCMPTMEELKAFWLPKLYSLGATESGGKGYIFERNGLEHEELGILAQAKLVETKRDGDMMMARLTPAGEDWFLQRDKSHIEEEDDDIPF